MNHRLLPVAAAASVTALLLFAGHASAHTPNHGLSCDGARLVGTNYDSSQTNTGFIYIDGVSQNDGELGGEDFGSSIDQTVPIPQDGAVHSVRFVIAIAEVDNASWELDVTEQVGPCGEVQTTTTEAATTTTTSEVTTSTSTTTSTTEPATSTSLASSTSTTTDAATTTTTASTTSSSVASTSTTSEPPSTPGPTTTTENPGTTPPAPSSTTPECSDNPATPGDDCAPICAPVTLEDGSNSCSPPLPATGSDADTQLITVALGLLLVSLGTGLVLVVRLRRS